MMRPIRSIFLAALPIVGVAAILPPFNLDRAHQNIPKLFYSAVQERGAPIWVAAELVRTPENQIDWKLFSQEERDALRRSLGQQEHLRAVEKPKSLSPLQASGREQVRDNNCILFQQPFYHLSEGLAAPDFRQLLASSRGIFSASISEISPGFFLGNPASVLKLTLSDVWKSEGNLTPVRELYAVYPFARFAIGDGVFCSGAPDSVPEPRIGQRVLAFVTSDSLDRQRTLIYLDPKFLIAERYDGGVILPRSLKKDAELFPVQTFDEMEELLRRAVQTFGGLGRVERPKDSGR